MDITFLAIITATFLLAGFVKGVIGLGLPTVSLGLLAATLDLTTAMALMIIPSFATNLWQAASGGNGRIIFHRIWAFLLFAAACIWFGALTLARIDLDILYGFLGFLLMAYAGLDLSGIRLNVPERKEPWAGILFGATNGVFTGMTGSFGIPGILYLRAIGLPKDMLVQAMGMLFTISTIALAIALGDNGLLSVSLGLTSLVALLPAVIGMFLGQKIRNRLSEAHFRKVFLYSILCLGAFIIFKAIASQS